MGRLFLALAAVLVAVPAPARAYYACNARMYTPGTPTGSWTCGAPNDCLDDATLCAAEDFGDDPVCDHFDEADPAGPPYCRPRCGTIFECSDGTACPALGAAGVCRLTAGSGSITRICTYPDPPLRINYCTGAGSTIPAGTLSECHRLPGTDEATSVYALGDCDGDGCANAVDEDPCNGAATGDCPVFSLDLNCNLITDGTPDAGPPLADAGTPGSDAGTAPPDAAAPRMDAGGGGLPLDPTDGIDFRGSGGCSCRATADPGAIPAGAGLSPVVVLLALRRRRAR